MKIVLLQTDIVWKTPEANMRRATELMSESSGADLFVLPEVFATGFTTEPSGAPDTDGSIRGWMSKTARRTGAAIAGTVIVEDGGCLFNRFYFVKPDEEASFYDKRHLFSFAGEDRIFTAGDRRVTVEWKEFRMLLQVCYDLRFPVFARNRGDYDAIIYVANWPSVRIDAWNSLLKARAIENLSYVIGVNRTGADPYTAYSGGSFLFDYMGRKVAETGCGEETLEVEIDIEPLRTFRRKFPALDDADGFSLEI